MTIAIFGASGRTDAAHAALLLSDARLVDRGSARLVRVTLPGEAPLPEPFYRPDGMEIVQHACASPEAVDVVVAAETATDSIGGETVLDLPAACLCDPTLRGRIAVPVVVVGPAPLDEYVAERLLHDLRETAIAVTGPVVMPWLLGCGRGGSGAVRAFERAVSVLAGSPDGRPRTLPVVLPPLSRSEATRIVEGDRTARTLASGLRLLAALRAVRDEPDASSVAAEALAAALGNDVGLLKESDERDVGDRLRELADDLHAIRNDAAPTNIDLAHVPRIEDWKAGRREVRVLTGRVQGHPEIADGRPIVTSDLYASDGVTWARTMSRYYRLGKPARGQTSAGLR